MVILVVADTSENNCLIRAEYEDYMLNVNRTPKLYRLTIGQVLPTSLYDNV